MRPASPCMKARPALVVAPSANLPCARRGPHDQLALQSSTRNNDKNFKVVNIKYIRKAYWSCCVIMIRLFLGTAHLHLPLQTCLPTLAYSRYTKSKTIQGGPGKERTMPNSSRSCPDSSVRPSTMTQATGRLPHLRPRCLQRDHTYSTEGRV